MMRLKRTVLVVMWLFEGSAAPRRVRKEKVVSPTSSLFGVSSEPTLVPLDLLLQITDGFSKERKIGSGSYGEVYLGVHQYGQKIAVKKIYDMPGVDDEQFRNEFKNLTRLRHKNIVQLVGYCHDIQEVQVKYQGKLVIAEKINRALCLEYMPNGSLEKYISDECDKYDWHTGYGIINGICQDFGISRLFGDERTRATKSTLGTQGYLPPEYIRYNLISSKFDIFSLGVVIIKIMAGRSGYFNIADMSPQEFTNLVQEKWTNRLHETSNLMKAHSEQVKTCIEIGLRCVDDDRQRRPSIQDIVNRLHETETECAYAARKDRSSIYQIKVNNWKVSAYKQFDERENSEGLNPDYFMTDGGPVSALPLNNDAGPSVQAGTPWQYHNGKAAQHEVGDRHPLNGLSRAAVLSNNDAGPSYLEMLPFPQHMYEQTVHQGPGEHDPSVPQNGGSYSLHQGNILNDQGPLSAQPTIPFHNFFPDDIIADASQSGFNSFDFEPW
uniref:Predicted protein n=1 Tax=Hordeum vulgare subsp. vulgare TaxID=112509 RepID=F2E0I0_HORVV|nr:predicted protein [Hordeum vulgare subsp. vulgare]